MRRKLAIAIGALALTVASAPSAATAAEQAGTTHEVVRWAYQQRPGQPQEDLFVRDPVYRQAEVSTVPDGAVRIRLRDGTELRLGGDTTVTIDKYVYTPDQGPVGIATDLLEGAMRYVTGAIRADGHEVETPTVVIGVRGTRFDVAVAETGATRVNVLEGAVEVRSKATGNAVELEAGERVAVDGAGAFGAVGPGGWQPGPVRDARDAAPGGDGGSGGAGGHGGGESGGGDG